MESVLVAIYGIFQGVADDAISGIKTDLLGQAAGIYEKYKEMAIPFLQHTTSAIAGFFQAKGIINNIDTNLKINKLENENEDQSQALESLKGEVVDIKDSLDDKIARKRNITLKNVGKTQQMHFIVSQLKELFNDEKIGVPDIPNNCFNMEEYGVFLKESLENQNVSADRKEEINTALDIYKNNIGKMCRGLKVGKTGIVNKTKETIQRGIKSLGKTLSDTRSKATYTMKQLVLNAVEHGVTKNEVDAIRDIKPLIGRNNKDLEECVEME